MSWLGIAIGPDRSAAAAVLAEDRCEVVLPGAVEWLGASSRGDPRPAIVLALDRAGLDAGAVEGAGVVQVAREAWRAALPRHAFAYPRTSAPFAAASRDVLAGWVRLEGWLHDRGLRSRLTRVPAGEALAAAALARAAMPEALALAGPIGEDSLRGVILGGGERGSLRTTLRIPAPRGPETLLRAVARHIAVTPEDLPALAALHPSTPDNPLLALLDAERPSQDTLDLAGLGWDARGPRLPPAIVDLTGPARRPGAPIHAPHRVLAASALAIARAAVARAATTGFPRGSLPALVLCGTLARWLAGHPEFRASLPFEDVVLSGMGGPGALALGAALAVTPARDRGLAAHTVATIPPALPSPDSGERLEGQALGVSRFGRKSLLDCVRVHLEAGLPAAWFSAAPSLREGPDPTRCILVPPALVEAPAPLEPGSRKPGHPPVRPIWQGRVVHPLIAAEEGSRIGGVLALDGACLAAPRREPSSPFRRLDGRAAVVAVHPLLDPALHDLLVSREATAPGRIGMVDLRRGDGRTVATAAEAFEAARALGIPRLVLMDRILDLVPAREPFPVEWRSPLG